MGGERQRETHSERSGGASAPVSGRDGDRRLVKGPASPPPRAAYCDGGAAADGPSNLEPADSGLSTPCRLSYSRGGDGFAAARTH